MMFQEGSYTAFAIGGLVVMNLTTSSVGTAVGAQHRPAHRHHRPVPHLADAPQLDPRRAHVLGPAGERAVRHDRPPHRPRDRMAARQRARRRRCRSRRRCAVRLCDELGQHVRRSLRERSGGHAGDRVHRDLPAGVGAQGPASSSQTMPGWMQPITEWNPVSSVTTYHGALGNPNPAALSSWFHAQHPVLMSFAWTALLLAVCVPLATHLFERRTLD